MLLIVGACARASQTKVASPLLPSPKVESLPAPVPSAHPPRPVAPERSESAAEVEPIGATSLAAAAPLSEFVPGTGAFDSGLQDDGSMVVAADGTATAFQLSAPLYPCSYDMHDEYPQLKRDPRALQQLVRRTTIDFSFFLDQCPAYYPMMKRPQPGKTLTLIERVTNFIQAEQCRIDPFYSKGYWIPEAIERVDVCAVTLGGDWHVPSERELMQMTRTQRVALVNPTLPKGVSLGSMHQLSVYVRHNDGTLAIGQLQDGSIRDFEQPSLFPARVQPAARARPATQAPSGHFEGAVVVRCLRAPSSSNPPHPEGASCNPSAKGGGRAWRTEYATAAIDPKTSPERKEFERKLEYVLKEFERLPQYAPNFLRSGRGIAEPCGRAADSLSNASSELRSLRSGHLVLPTWREPLGSKAVARFRAVATQLLPIVQRQAAETKTILDHCERHPDIPPCRTDVIAPQRTLYSGHLEALRQLALILGK